MSEPTTEAGKRMLADASCFAGFGEDGMAAALAAIEAEAVNAERARITAALRAQPTPPRLYALSAWDLDCVLAIVNPEASRE